MQKNYLTIYELIFNKNPLLKKASLFTCLPSYKIRFWPRQKNEPAQINWTGSKCCF